MESMGCLVVRNFLVFSILLIVLATLGRSAVGQVLQPLKPVVTDSQGNSAEEASAEIDTPGQPMDEKDMLSRLSQAAKRLENNQKFDLKYTFTEGETILWRVEHTATTDTRVQVDEETSASRSLSMLQWQVTDVDTLGNTTIALTLKSAVMWQQTDQNDPITYDSRKHRGEVPEVYRSFADWLGVPMATYKIDPQGKVIDRKEVYYNVKFGVGNITMPLPGHSVRIGDAWHSPGSIGVKTPDGIHKSIRTRIEYRLQRVSDGIALVSFDTQVLTPVDDPRVESQLIQQLSQGIIRFDMNQGQMISKQLGWSEKCLGFKGPESSLSYLAKYDVRKVEQKSDSETVNVTEGVDRLQPVIRLSDDGPIFRW